MTDEEAKALLKRVTLLEERDRHVTTLWRWRFMRPLVAVFLSMFATAGVSMWYTTISLRQNEQTWCELVGPLDKTNQATPPPTVQGRTFATSIHHISTKFHCK